MLFPDLRRLKEDAKGPDSILYRIGAIFEQLATAGTNATNGTTATNPSRWTLDPAMLDLSVNNPNRIIFPG